MQYGINATFMQMYSSLIDYSNKIYKERSRNIIGPFLEATLKSMLHVVCVHAQKRKNGEESQHCRAFPEMANSCCIRNEPMATEGQWT